MRLAEYTLEQVKNADEFSLVIFRNMPDGACQSEIRYLKIKRRTPKTIFFENHAQANRVALYSEHKVADAHVGIVKEEKVFCLRGDEHKVAVAYWTQREIALRRDAVRIQEKLIQVGNMLDTLNAE